jgi:hypothetical protein
VRRGQRRAESFLKRAQLEPVGQEYRERCLALADRLREGIRIQMSVERHGAVRKDRGAIIDSMDDPLNDAPYLLDQMQQARQLASEVERLEAIETTLNRTNPGPGGFYDDFGSEASLRRVVAPPRDWESDPGTLKSILRGFPGLRWQDGGRPVPLAWSSDLTSLFDQPISVRYQNLDPEASYRIRVAHGRPRGPRPRLEADGHLLYDFADTSEASPVESPCHRGDRDGGDLHLDPESRVGERRSRGLADAGGRSMKTR